MDRLDIFEINGSLTQVIKLVADKQNKSNKLLSIKFQLNYNKWNINIFKNKS